MRAVHIMDLTGAETLMSIHEQLKRNNVRLVIAELPAEPFDLLKKSGAVEKLGEENFYSDYAEAIAYTNKWMLETTCNGCSAVLTGATGHPGPKDCGLRQAMKEDKAHFMPLIEGDPCKAIVHYDRPKPKSAGSVEAKPEESKAATDAEAPPALVAEVPTAGGNTDDHHDKGAS